MKENKGKQNFPNVKVCINLPKPLFSVSLTFKKITEGYYRRNLVIYWLITERHNFFKDL
jgi:hypothetical protein